MFILSSFSPVVCLSPLSINPSFYPSILSYFYYSIHLSFHPSFPQSLCPVFTATSRLYILFLTILLSYHSSVVSSLHCYVYPFFFHSVIPSSRFLVLSSFYLFFSAFPSSTIHLASTAFIFLSLHLSFLPPFIQFFLFFCSSFFSIFLSLPVLLPFYLSSLCHLHPCVLPSFYIIPAFCPTTILMSLHPALSCHS